jgi:Rap1a immunity proteins
MACKRSSIIARSGLFIGVILGIVTGGSSRAKPELGIYSALYVYQGCKLAESFYVSPDGTVMLSDPGAAFCWGAFTVLRGVTNILSDDHRTMALHVCAPTESTVSQYIRIFLKYVDDHPEIVHQDFDFVALNALMWAFPCQSRPSVK